ncbi:MAG TPA: hypothetical protein VFO16_01025 [Pseudonocardiaceae bacterium]|nr:hypothetical protein [Pseudonocardiaceae bacterium]
MAARDPVRVGAVLLAVVMAVGSAVLAWKLWPPASGGDYRAAHGTVVESVVCGPPGARDLVRVELPDGRVLPARLDGCGHRLGEMLRLDVPVPVPQGEFVVRLAGTGVSTAATDGQRLSTIGVVLAGMAGALFAGKLPGGWITPRRRLSS